MQIHRKSSRRRFLQAASALTVSAPAIFSFSTEGANEPAMVLENDFVKYVIGADGRNRSFIDKRTGRDYCRRDLATAFLCLKKNGKTYVPSRCSPSGHQITTEFSEPGATVTCRVRVQPRYFTIEVTRVAGEEVEELTLADLRLEITKHLGKIANVAWDDQFAVAVMALNLRTNAGGKCDAGLKCDPQARLWSACYRKLGMEGAKIALLGCPAPQLRQVIQEMVSHEGFIRSEVGGAWALDAPETNYSYLFAISSEADVDDWIALARTGGFKEVLVSEIGPYGHYHPDPVRYPHGMDGVKAVVDKIHAAGMKAGWHMLAFTIAKNDSWVTPIPDRRLATRNVLTLAAPISADATFVPTVESPQDLPVHSGFWFRGGMDVHLEDEIFSYAGVQTTPPFGLTGCTRGARKTKAAPHSRGASLRNLQEVFGLYVPDAHSTLFEELAERVAEIIRSCGFDKIYFDGLDGADVFAGSDWSWHYGPRFALEVFRRAGARLQVEASAWYHHTWHLTSRLGAWDHPTRDPKRFIDLHVDGNHALGDLVHTQLGWWSLQNYKDRLAAATTRDVVEYLAVKCLGNDMAFSLEEVKPADLLKNANWARLLPVLGQYEPLRSKGAVSEDIKAKLRVPGEEFTLVSQGGQSQFLPVTYDEHKVTAVDGVQNILRVTNRYSAQKPRFRIQALMSAAPYDAPGNKVLADFDTPGEFGRSQAAPGVSCQLGVSNEQVKVGKASGSFAARNNKAERRGAWAMWGKSFAPLVNISNCPALGVWVLGDAKGEVINLQLVDVTGPGPAVGEHYVIVDFKGWRYFELVEPEGKRWSDYLWPYDNPLAVYRETPDNTQITELNIYYNNLPPKDTVNCLLSPVKGLTVNRVELQNPRLSLGDATLTFPVTLETGYYVEFNSMEDCKLYDPNGTFLGDCSPVGEVPTLGEGVNRMIFACDGPDSYNARALVTNITSGAPLTTSQETRS
jgi:hypothetical protein